MVMWSERPLRRRGRFGSRCTVGEVRDRLVSCWIQGLGGFRELRLGGVVEGPVSRWGCSMRLFLGGFVDVSVRAIFVGMAVS